MKRGRKSFALLAFLLSAGLHGHSAFCAGTSGGEASGGEQPGFTAGGYFKSFFTVLQPAEEEGIGPLAGGKPTEGTSSNNFRIKLNYKDEDAWSVNAAYELIPQTLPENLTTLVPLPQVNPFVYRAYDMDGLLYPQPNGSSSGFMLAQNLDRLFVTYSPSFGDIMIGRQPIAFGSAHVINPTDVLAPFTFQTLDKEDRTGVDAVRVRIPSGALGEFDAGYVLGKGGQLDRSAIFAKQKANICNSDWTVLLMDFQQNFMLGLDFDRSVGGASVWVEAAYVWAGMFGDRRPQDDYLRVSTGADYNLTPDLYALIEYHYNGAGTVDSSGYLDLFQQTAYTEGSVYLLGRHYLIPGLTWQITPLLTLTGEALWNLNDMSFFISPVWDYNFANDVTLEAGAFIPAGRPSIAQPTSLETRSEFGLYPAIYYASIKVYY